MRHWFQCRWLWLALLIVLVLVGGLVFLQQSTVNPLHPALDKLAAVTISERWSHPEMVKICQLGKDAVPSLRRVLREKDRPSTRFLLWLKSKWPGVTRFYPHIPDTRKLTERRWAACQVLMTLGPAGKDAVPELIRIMASKDPTTPIWNWRPRPASLLPPLGSRVPPKGERDESPIAPNCGSSDLAKCL